MRRCMENPHHAAERVKRPVTLGSTVITHRSMPTAGLERALVREDGP